MARGYIAPSAVQCAGADAFALCCVVAAVTATAIRPLSAALLGSRAAGFDHALAIHPHRLRCAGGFALAAATGDGSDWRLLAATAAAIAAARLRRPFIAPSRIRLQIPFRRFFYRGYEVHKLLDLTHAELMKLLHARARRHFARGSTSKAGAKLLKRLRQAKKDAPENEKPETIKTHMRNQIILPEMVASVIGVYNGLNFTQVRRRGGWMAIEGADERAQPTVASCSSSLVRLLIVSVRLAVLVMIAG